MCYSVKFAECHAYQAEHGWVMRGWKWVRVHADGSLGSLNSDVEHVYRVGELVFDRHGWHVAATKRGAIKAAFGWFCNLYDARTGERTLRGSLSQRIRDCQRSWALCEVFAPERAQREDGHVDRLVLLAPWATEADRQRAIALCDARNKIDAERERAREATLATARAKCRALCGLATETTTATPEVQHA